MAKMVINNGDAIDARKLRRTLRKGFDIISKSRKAHGDKQWTMQAKRIINRLAWKRCGGCPMA